MLIERDPRAFFRSSGVRIKTAHKLPGSFVIVDGFGESSTSNLNAFDNALVAAGIGGYNLVKYSSVIPLTSIPKEKIESAYGSQLGVIISHQNGKEGKKIAAAIGVAPTRDYYVVFESTAETAKEAEQKLQMQLNEAIQVRNEETNGIFITSIEGIVKEKYGCVLVCIAFDSVEYL